MDKKSLTRLLQKLAKDNFIKYMNLTLTNNDVTKVVTMICDHEVELDNPILRTKIDKLKGEFCLSSISRLQAVNIERTISLSNSKTTKKAKRLLKANIHVKPCLVYVPLKVVILPIKMNPLLMKSCIYRVSEESTDFVRNS